MPTPRSSLDRRQRDVHDRVVEHDHEQAERDRARASTTCGFRAAKRRAFTVGSRLVILVQRNVFAASPTLRADERRRLDADSRAASSSANVVAAARATSAVEGYAELHRVSIEEPERFWPALIEDLGPRVLAALGAGASTLARRRVGEVVRGRKAQHRVELRAPLGERRAGRAAAAVWLGEDGTRRELTFAELSRRGRRGSPRRCVELGVERRRSRRDLPADVARGRDRVARVRAPRRGAGADLLRLRARPRSRSDSGRCEARSLITARRLARAAGTLCRCGRSLDEARRATSPARRVAPARVDAPMRTAEIVAGTSRRGQLPGARGRLGASVPARRTRQARPASRRARCTSQGGFLVSIAREVAYQADVTPGDVIHFATDMGWIMGPWTVVGGRRARRDGRLRRRRAGLAGRPALAARSSRSA